MRLSDPSLSSVVRDELQAAATARLPSLGATVVASSDEVSRRWVERDAENDQSLFAMFAVLMLAGATFAAFNLTTRIVESQRRQIGIGLALGLPARTLAIRPLAVAAEIALLGVALGIVTGMLFGAALREVMVGLLPMPVFESRRSSRLSSPGPPPSASRCPSRPRSIPSGAPSGPDRWTQFVPATWPLDGPVWPASPEGCRCRRGCAIRSATSCARRAGRC